MVNRNQSVNKQRQRYRSLIATALLTSSLFQFIAPVLAEGTTAGQEISNEATATYEDPNNPGTTINATSNIVIVTVAEVAGITVTASGVVDNNGGSVAVNDLLIYTYTLTNVGNDPTRFRIPNLATTTGPGSVAGRLPGGEDNRLQYSIDGGNSWQNITDAEAITPSVAPGGTVLVRVPVTVQLGALTNDVITVTLGNTPGGAQNQLRSPDGGDVYTVDNPDGAVLGEVPGAPVNGVREASATQQIQVGASLKTYALATILKTRTGYDPGSDATTLTDDKLTYDLSLRVESNDVTGKGIAPAPLTGTSINLNGNPVSRILISDAIPVGTRLAAVPVPPPGWDVVYTTDLTNIAINQASWKTFPLQSPDTLASVTRIGFINKPGSISAVAPGQTVSGFSIQLAVTANTSTATIANIAQVFGQTSGTNTLVYDESGDQNPSNFNGTLGLMNLPALIDPDQDGLPNNNVLVTSNITSGFINNPLLPSLPIDSGNNNTGTGLGGDINQFILQTSVALAVLNGPQNAPDAIGPTNNNDDFTNKSALVPADTPPGSLLDPSPVAFTNTIRNSGTNAGTITLVPTKPTNGTDLPDGAKVTITYGSQSAIYNYTNAGGFALQSGSIEISIPNVAPGTTLNYGVEVDLPNNTPLSTDINRGFPVPITATVTASGISSINTTINRVYTGYLRLVKLSRILQGTGPVVQANDGIFSPNPKRPAPGNIIEYQIQYKNISDPQAGIGNVILNADKIVITEDGTTDSPNNWALDNDNNGQIDTSNIARSARDSGAATINFFSGNPATTSSLDQTGTTVNTDVTKYVNIVTGKVVPGEERTFTFQRRVN